MSTKSATAQMDANFRKAKQELQDALSKGRTSLAILKQGQMVGITQCFAIVAGPHLDYRFDEMCSETQALNAEISASVNGGDQ